MGHTGLASSPERKKGRNTSFMSQATGPPATSAIPMRASSRAIRAIRSVIVCYKIPDLGHGMIAEFRPPRFNDLIIYQLHVGVFNGPNRPSRVAKFLDVLGKLDYLVALGVNAVLLLPIVEVASGRSLGYEGFDIFSPEMDYGVAPGAELQGYLGFVNGLRARFGMAALTEDELAPRKPAESGHRTLPPPGSRCAARRRLQSRRRADEGTGREPLVLSIAQLAPTQNDSLYFTDQDHAGPVWAIWRAKFGSS